MKKYISMIVASLLMVSCVDTIILPENKTVDEDFWKSQSDVELMVNGAYSSMLTTDVIKRLIVWGDLRSDELIPANLSGSTYEDLVEINLANTQPDNEFATWGSIYHVINNCNIVLAKAAGAMDEDPSYTEGTYKTHCSQMLALRALCYFYLVRNFRDVPYVTEAYMTSSQDRNIPQSTPDVVLQGCIDDLVEAEKNALNANTYTDWRRVGWFNRDGINALLADIYLWRASVLHSTADYEQAVSYCDKVIASKQAQHERGFGETEEVSYPLASDRNRFGYPSFVQLFVIQNAEESILELQFNGSENYDSGNKEYRGNRGVCELFAHYNRSATAVPYLYASDLFLPANATTMWSDGTNPDQDYRRFNLSYTEEVTVGEFTCTRVRKFVTMNPNNLSDAVKSDEYVNRAYTAYKQNYVVYRLSDVMLMKAEALAALATSDEDTDHLTAAFSLVQAVNNRSKVQEADSLDQTKYNTREDIENLVLRERFRELAFEGKRWYDLMRYNYRHVEGVDYSTLLADQATHVPAYSGMLDLMKRKLGSKGNAVSAKMGDEPRLYMPVPLGDLKICPVLKQNPAYSSTDNYTKDY